MASEVVQAHLPCPSCSSSDAYSLYSDGHGYCFSCKTYTKGNQAFETEGDYTYEFLPRRNINKETFRFYDVKTKIDSTGKPVCVGYRYPSGHHKVRFLDKKEFTWPDGGGTGLFGRDKFESGCHSFVTITEGEDDALSLYQVLRSPVVSVQSSSTAHRDCSVDRSWLMGFDTIVLAFDGDRSGREARDQVARMFDYDKVRVLNFTKFKDANDYLQHGDTDDLRTLWHNARPYMPDTLVSSLDEFKNILETTPKEGVPYPFSFLNDMTYGMRTGESVLITAQEGIGKTELMHALEYQLLTATNDNVGAIFLEEPKARHLQAIAGIHLQNPVHLPDSGASTADVVGAVSQVVRRDGRLHLYSNFGSVDPEILADNIRFLVACRGCRWVLLDHITMVCSGLGEKDERRQLDNFSTKLETLVKELDFGLIVVSHVNDEGLTRGSRYVSKVCDIRIDLKRDVLSIDSIQRRTTELTVSKNRFSGKTGVAGSIIFDPVKYTFNVANDNDIRIEELVA
jgi:Autographiviridae DNA primase/helicase